MKENRIRRSLALLNPEVCRWSVLSEKLPLPKLLPRFLIDRCILTHAQTKCFSVCVCVITIKNAKIGSQSTPNLKTTHPFYSALSERSSASHMPQRDPCNQRDSAQNAAGIPDGGGRRSVAKAVVTLAKRAEKSCLRVAGSCDASQCRRRALQHSGRSCRRTRGNDCFR